MYHSITFSDGSDALAVNTASGRTYILANGVNTWDDWYLIPSKRPDIALPGVSTNFLDIPGRDGSLDISEALTGHQVYSDRSGSLEFYVDNEKKNDHSEFHGNWADLRNQIVRYLHGKRKCMVLESEPNYYYEGRFTVSGWASEASYSRITIDYRLQPFKYEISNMNYKHGTNPNLGDVALRNQSITRQITGRAYGTGLPLVVRMSAGSMVTASFGGVEATLTPTNPEAELGEGTSVQSENILTLSGTGLISMSFGGGML